MAKTDTLHEEGEARASWKTERKSQKKHLSYDSRLSMTFAAIAAMTVMVLVIVLATVWEGEFRQYARSNMEAIAQAAATTLGERYEEAGTWNEEVIGGDENPLTISADVGFQVLDAGGNVIYDDTWAPTPVGALHHEARQHESTEGEVPPTMVSLAPTDAGSIATAPITTPSGVVVGAVRVWALGNDRLLTKADTAFRTASYNAIFLAAVIAILVASAIGSRFARTIAKPVNRVTSTAAQIRNGDLTARTGIVGDDEVGRLGETFDSMANRLERDVRMEKRLTSDVAHELRTPLMAMLATVEAMQDGVLPADSEHLGVVRDEVKRLSRLVDAMLRLSRLENGSIPFEPVETDIVSLVRNLVTSQEQLFQAKDLRLRFDDETPYGECLAIVDPDMVTQAITNFLSNAMRYTSEGGWVIVKVSQDREDVLISVEDTGMGIAPEDLSRVFNRFWRSDASRVQESGGLGVGLSVTKEIADKHQGHVSVESELGRGSTFTLHLPRKKLGQ